MNSMDYVVMWYVTLPGGEVKLFMGRVEAWHFATWAEGASSPRKVGLAALPDTELDA